MRTRLLTHIISGHGPGIANLTTYQQTQLSTSLRQPSHQQVVPPVEDLFYWLQGSWIVCNVSGGDVSRLWPALLGP